MNLGLLGLERKETEGLLEIKVLGVFPVSRVLRVSEVPVALLDPRAPQALWVPKGSEVKWDFQV